MNHAARALPALQGTQDVGTGRTSDAGYGASLGGTLCDTSEM